MASGCGPSNGHKKISVGHVGIYLQEEFEDTKGVIRICKFDFST